MKHTRRVAFILGALLVGFYPCGCGGQSKGPPPASDSLRDTKWSLWLEPGLPLAAALRFHLNEWESRTGSTVTVHDQSALSSEYDLVVGSLATLGNLENLVPLSNRWLRAKELAFDDLSPLHRRIFCSRDGKVCLLPLTSEVLVLWYRADLYSRPAIADAYQAETGQKLQVPETWTEYMAQARFFQQTQAPSVRELIPPLRFGCVEATDGSPVALGHYLARAACYGKRPNEYSFELDVDTGKPRWTGAHFERALMEWQAALAYSPAAGGKRVSDEQARAYFRQGEAALLLSRLPPGSQASGTSRADGKGTIPAASLPNSAMGVAALPGTRELLDAATDTLEKVDSPRFCAHLGSGGIYVAIRQSENVELALKLLPYLARALPDEEGNHYLTRAARTGIAPAHPALLGQPALFRGYGLTPETTRRWFALLKVAPREENWIADLRFAQPARLQDPLAEALQSTLTGKVTPQAALRHAQERWNALPTREHADILDQYRRDLGLSPRRP